MAEVLASSSEEYTVSTESESSSASTKTIDVAIEDPIDLASIQPLYAFVEITIGGKSVTDFSTDFRGTNIDMDYTRKTGFTSKTESGNSISLTLYDDTALEVEELITNNFYKTDRSVVVSYGWSYKGQEKYAIRDLNICITDYGISFEGASMSLTIQGTVSEYYEASTDQKTESYDAETYQGKPSEIVKYICDENGWEIGYIEETEPCYDDDGSVKTFIRTNQTSTNFCQSLEEYCVSAETGVQQYRFFFGEDGKVYFVSVDYADVPAVASSELANNIISGDTDSGGNVVDSVSSSDSDDVSYGGNSDVITRKYEFYSGRKDNTVISFTPEIKGMSVSSVTIASGASVDTATNEMIECSIDGLSIDNLTDVEATRMMGLSSSSKSNLKQKAASMWNYFACNSYPATLEIMGDPTIKVSSYIYVTVYTKYGYPHHTSGVYQITKANDNISGGTYITTLTLQKVGSSKARISSETDSEASSTSTDSSGNTGTLSSDETYSDKANKIIAATSTVPSAGSGYCAKWVSQVYEAAGLGYIGGNACDMYNNYCTSSDLSDLEPGMIVAVSTHSHSTSGQKYGHVGIYIGDGMVVSNIGTIKTQTLDSFISYYGDTVTVKWGWAK